MKYEFRIAFETRAFAADAGVAQNRAKTFRINQKRICIILAKAVGNGFVWVLVCLLGVLQAGNYAFKNSLSLP